MAKVEKPSKTLVKGKFSCSNVELLCDTKEEFVKQFAGKLDVDINSLWADIAKAKAALKRAADKPEKEESKRKGFSKRKDSDKEESTEK